MSTRNFYVEGVMGEGKPFSHSSRGYHDGCSLTVYQRSRNEKVPAVFIEGICDLSKESLTLVVLDSEGIELFRHTTMKGSDGMVTIRKCNCASAYQDEHYGKGMRIFNRGAKVWTCTVCGATQPAGALTEQEIREGRK